MCNRLFCSPSHVIRKTWKWNSRKMKRRWNENNCPAKECIYPFCPFSSAWQRTAFENRMAVPNWNIMGIRSKQTKKKYVEALVVGFCIDFRLLFSEIGSSSRFTFLFVIREYRINIEWLNKFIIINKPLNLFVLVGGSIFRF